jgi:hypothetical protein
VYVAGFRWKRHITKRRDIDDDVVSARTHKYIVENRTVTEYDTPRILFGNQNGGKSNVTIQQHLTFNLVCPDDHASCNWGKLGEQGGFCHNLIQ